MRWRPLRLLDDNLVRRVHHVQVMLSHVPDVPVLLPAEGGGASLMVCMPVLVGACRRRVLAQLQVVVDVLRQDCQVRGAVLRLVVERGVANGQPQIQVDDAIALAGAPNST